MKNTPLSLEKNSMKSLLNSISGLCALVFYTYCSQDIVKGSSQIFSTFFQYVYIDDVEIVSCLCQIFSLALYSVFAIVMLSGIIEEEYNALVSDDRS
jgi:hypothetical protein